MKQFSYLLDPPRSEALEMLHTRFQRLVNVVYPNTVLWFYKEYYADT